VQGLLSQFDGDLNLVANHLKLMQNKMCLLNPVSDFEGLIMLRNLTVCRKRHPKTHSIHRRKKKRNK
jgi:hypothetical protein